MTQDFENRKALFVDEIRYTVVMVFKGKAYREQFTFQELFFYKEGVEEREVVFAISEDFEKVIKMNQGDQMPIRVTRDLDEWGIIERTN